MNLHLVVNARCLGGHQDVFMIENVIVSSFNVYVLRAGRTLVYDHRTFLVSGSYFAQTQTCIL